MVAILSYICIVMRSIFYQLPSCNLFTQHVIYLYGDTTSELRNPIHSFTLIKPPTANNCSLLLPAIKYYFPHHTFNSLLQQAGKIDNLPISLGQNSLIVLCAGSTSVAGFPGVALCHIPPPTTFRSDFLLLLVD